jgi:hypothetical protein
VPAAVPATFDSDYLPPSAAGEHLPAIPLISSLRFVPQTPRPPSPPATRAPGALELLYVRPRTDRGRR